MGHFYASVGGGAVRVLMASGACGLLVQGDGGSDKIEVRVIDADALISGGGVGHEGCLCQGNCKPIKLILEGVRGRSCSGGGWLSQGDTEQVQGHWP